MRAQQLISDVQRLMSIHGNGEVLWQDPETGLLYPVQVQQAIALQDGKARVYFALVPLIPDLVDEA